MIDDDHFLIDFHTAVVHFADTDASDIFVVVDGADKQLRAGIRISGGGRNVCQDRVKERRHVTAFCIRIRAGSSCFGRCIDEGTVQLFIVGIQIHEQFQYLVNDLSRSGFRPVALVDTYDDGQFQFQSLPQYELGLRHGSLEGVYYKNNTVHHLEDTLHFSAEICVAGRIYDIDLNIFISNRSVLG